MWRHCDEPGQATPKSRASPPSHGQKVAHRAPPLFVALLPRPCVVPLRRADEGGHLADPVPFSPQEEQIELSSRLQEGPHSIPVALGAPDRVNEERLSRATPHPRGREEAAQVGGHGRSRLLPRKHLESRSDSLRSRRSGEARQRRDPVASPVLRALLGVLEELERNRGAMPVNVEPNDSPDDPRAYVRSAQPEILWVLAHRARTPELHSPEGTADGHVTHTALSC